MFLLLHLPGKDLLLLSLLLPAFSVSLPTGQKGRSERITLTVEGATGGGDLKLLLDSFMGGRQLSSPLLVSLAGSLVLAPWTTASAALSVMLHNQLPGM